MSLDISNIKVVCFDLGNTLIEFGPSQIAAQNVELRKVLAGMFGHCDAERLEEVRKRHIVAPYDNGYRENELPVICRELIEELYGIDPAEEQVATLVEARQGAFVEAVQVADGILPLLGRLGERYRLALLSNYPCGRSIRAGLRKTGLSDLFETIVVSGDVGFIKPHRKPFDILLEGLKSDASECVYIGDNWLADVQGAKGVGMRAVLTSQHVPYETFEPGEGDHEPDARIGHIEELERILLV